MVRSKGKKANSRNLLSKPYRSRGQENISINLIEYRKGDIVDIKIDSSIHKGQPYKYYHGKTAKILSIQKNSAVVEIEKIVKQRKISKKLTIRFEHINKNKSNLINKETVKLRDKARTIAKNTGKKLVNFDKSKPCVNQEKIISFNQIDFIHPEPYSLII